MELSTINVLLILNSTYVFPLFSCFLAELCVVHFPWQFIHHIRDIKDPEHPYSLEELKVITEDAIEVDDSRSYVR